MLDKAVRWLLALGPILITALTFSNILYTSIISIFSDIKLSNLGITLIHLITLIASVFYLRKYWDKFYVKTPSRQLLLLIPYLLIILLRFPIVYPTHDDLAAHFFLGDYSNRIWENEQFMPAHWTTYFYPATDMNFTPFLFTVGMRGTIFTWYLLTAFWLVSLNLKLKLLTKNQTKKFLLNLIFITLPFVPHLIATHGTLMVDFIALAVVLETFYLFINKETDKTFAVIMLGLTTLVKQSTALFLFPIFLYLVAKNYKKIRWKEPLVISMIASLFFIRLLLETGNPLFGLYNSIFKSSLYALDNFRDISFGPTNWKQVLLWLVFGQFSDRFGQGAVSFHEKLIFSPFYILPVVFSLLLAIRRKSLKYICFLLALLGWSFLSGYSRYVIPLNALALLSAAFDTKTRNNKILSLATRNKVLIYFLLMILSLSSLKTDFSWRPYPLISSKQSIVLFLNTYSEGLIFSFKDTLQAFADYHKDEFEGYDAVVPIYRGPVTFYAYLGYLNGLKVIKANTTSEQDLVNEDDKVSEEIKMNALQLGNMNRILVVVEKQYEQFMVSDWSFKKSFSCSRNGNAKFSPMLQTRGNFEDIIRYSCQRKNLL